jgi:predicted ester cyclase
MSSEAMKELLKRNLQIWNEGDLARFDEVFSPNYCNRSSGTDRATLKQVIVAMRQAFPDLHVSVDQQIVEGDIIVTRWSATGTHQGNHYGVTGMGKKMHNTGIGIDRIADGKIVESWGNSDELGMFKQLGLLP